MKGVNTITSDIMNDAVKPLVNVGVDLFVFSLATVEFSLGRVSTACLSQNLPLLQFLLLLSSRLSIGGGCSNWTI